VVRDTLGIYPVNNYGAVETGEHFFYERQGDVDLALGAYALAGSADDRDLRGRALERLRERLTLMPGSFPNGITFAPESLGAVLVCRVMHFFDGPTIELAAAKIMSWLAPGGKVFVVGETPFIGTARAFFPTYEARVKAGEPWPGIVENVAAHDPGRAGNLPSRMHLLDEATLKRVFSGAGFTIEKLGTFARPEFPPDIQLDGRESVGLIARK